MDHGDCNDNDCCTFDVIGMLGMFKTAQFLVPKFPSQMEALSRKNLCKPVEIVVGARSVVAPEISQIVVEIRDEKQKFFASS
jgi:hypothetical protein